MAQEIDPGRTETKRCEWAGKESMIRYHDEQWGVPIHDDGALFEMLILEGAQAGLSWDTILNKRESYRRAFHQFDPEVIAMYGEQDVTRLLGDPGIVRNRLKVRSAIGNAKAFLAIQEEYGSFDAYIWQFVGGRPKVGHRQSMEDIPAKTDISDIMSKDLKKRGFKFVGSTICYAYMQSVGMVNDHTIDCFRYTEIG